MAETHTTDIRTRFDRRVKSKVSQLFTQYKDNDKTINLRAWLKNAITQNLKGTNWEDYTKDNHLDPLLADVPETVTHTTERELEKDIDTKYVPYSGYIQSLIYINHYFTTCEKMNGWLPLYVGRNPATFTTKMMELCPWKIFCQIPKRKLFPIFAQMEVLMGSIDRNVDDERVQSELAMAVIRSTFVASQVKAVNLEDLQS